MHERFEWYFKEHFTYLLQQRYYDPQNHQHRQLMTYVFTPVIQRECDKFVSNWNTCRIHSYLPVLLSSQHLDNEEPTLKIAMEFDERRYGYKTV